MIKVHHVVSAVIELDDGSVFVSVSSPHSHPNIFETLSHTLFDDLKDNSRYLLWPFSFEDTEQQQFIGTLTIFYDTQVLTDSLFSQLKFSLFATLTRTLLITLVLSMIFHRFLTRPIARISEAIDNIDPESPDENLLPIDKSHINDELGLVTSKFNHILIKFGQTQNRLRKMATRDPLTSLPNRTLLLEKIAVTIHVHMSTKSNLAWCLSISTDSKTSMIH